MAAKKKSNPVGRPSVFTKQLGLSICSRIAAGESLRSICKDDKMPVMSTVMLWVIDGLHEEFSEQYAKSRQVQAELLADELFDIADDGTNDWMERLSEGKDGYIANGEHIQRSRLRVDTRKWYLSKVLPKFADKKEIDHKSTDGSMTPSKLSDEEIDQRINKLLSQVDK